MTEEDCRSRDDSEHSLQKCVFLAHIAAYSEKLTLE